ncbi:uncharacterized protein LOC125034486 [Penaeus chinensis]|uniref:uncharacterized protein LOC125034486 n=1 Tax=Penaeus chinensis TaxID=139456 RepID=UPI001FB83AE8|nr:uncharacterized protein LOC125034486 [Penaeus chinensis]
MKVTLILVLMAVVGLSSAYSLGDVSEKLQRVERDISAGSTGTSNSMSLESREKRDISGDSTGTSSLETRERRDAFAVSHDLDLRRLRRRASPDSGSSESNSASSSEEMTTTAP